MPKTFSSEADFQRFTALHDVYHVDASGQRTKMISTLEEALAAKATAGFILVEGLSSAVDSLVNNRDNIAHGLEQQTTRSISINPQFNVEFGPLRLIAGGESVKFYRVNSPDCYAEIDGMAVGPKHILMNETKTTPQLSDVHDAIARAEKLRVIVASPNDFTSMPPIIHNMKDAAHGSLIVVPVLCGYFFEPSVLLSCKSLGVRTVTTDGFGFDSALIA